MSFEILKELKKFYFYVIIFTINTLLGENMTYKEAIIKAFQELGGHARNEDLYVRFKEIYDGELISTWRDSVRNILYRNSSDSPSFNGKEDLFVSYEGVEKAHWGLRDFASETHVELTQEDDEFSEGKIFLKKHLQRERNVKLIELSKKKFIEKNGRLYCEVCGFDFAKTYGDLGEKFIEAHHIKPVSQMAENEKTSIDDIVMVCSNCHSMIHRKKPWLTIDKIKSIVKD